MRLPALSLTLFLVCALADCTSTEQSSSNQSATNTAAAKTTAPPPTATAPATEADKNLPVAPAHGSGAPPAASNPPANEQPDIDTSALDAKIEKAEAKAKAKNATQADKLAAAAAYLERANIFMNAGNPKLYKFALRDYRRTLRYEPDNKQAQDSANMIVSIYQSMGRPVPDLGNEP